MIPRAAADYSRQQIMHLLNSRLHYSIAFNIDGKYPGNSWKERQQRQQQWLD